MVVRMVFRGGSALTGRIGTPGIQQPGQLLRNRQPMRPDAAPDRLKLPNEELVPDCYDRLGD